MASSTRIKALDKVFSMYIRLRDSKEFDFTAFRCCACRQIKPFSMADAGHFVNRRFMSVRWNETNVNAECSACNRYEESNSSGYSLFMLKKYGKNHIEYLDGLKRTPAKFIDSELKLIELDYKKKIKVLQSK